MIFKQGDSPKGVFILKSGLVKIVYTSPAGQRTLVYIYKPGDWFGYRQALTMDNNQISAIAIEKVEVDFISNDDFIKLIEEHPKFSHNLLVTLSHEFTIWVKRLSLFTRLSVKTRLAICLLILHERFKSLGQEPTVILFSRPDLADFIGVTIESTVRALSEFKAQGLVAVRGRSIRIKDTQALYDSIGEV
ncbi:MAG: Crp/Fnr family transcriptional regulator [Saprospiraceae bacterium]|nr:Crp/Fnr family transcriptional regulator [Saprospiraceae bacterium]